MKRESRNQRNRRRNAWLSAAVCLVSVLVVTSVWVRFRSATADAQSVETKRYKPELVVQTGHSLPVSFLSFSPDGKLIVSGDGQTTKLWDAATGQELRTINELQTDYLLDYRRFSFGADSKYLIDETTLIDATTGKLVRTFRPVLPVSYATAVSRDNSKFVSVGGGYVQVWSVATGETLRLFTAEAATLSHTGMLFASYGPANAANADQVPRISNSNIASTQSPAVKDDHSIHITSLETGSEIQKFAGVLSRPAMMSFSGDGKRLITADAEGLKAWDLVTGKHLGTLKIDLPNLGSVDPGPTGESVIYRSRDESLRTDEFRLWDVAGSTAKTIAAGNDAYEAWRFVGVNFSPDGKTLAVSEFSGGGGAPAGKVSVSLVNAFTGTVKKKFDIGTPLKSYAAVPAVFSGDGGQLAVANGNGFETLDPETGNLITKFSGFANTRSRISLDDGGKTIAESAATQFVSPNGDQNYTGGDATLIWQLGDDKRPRRIEGSMEYTGPFRHDSYAMATMGGQFINHHRRFLITQVNPSGQNDLELTETQILKNRTYHVWDLETGAERPDLSRFIKRRKDEKGIYLDDFGLGPDGKRAFFLYRKYEAKNAGPDAKPSVIEMWDVAADKPIWKLDRPAGTTEADFDETGTDVVVQIGDSLGYFDAATGQLDLTRAPVKLPPGQIPNPAFMTINGIDVIAQIQTGRVSLYNSGTQELMAELYWLNKDDWAVITPSGLFDASDGAQEAMHFVVADEQTGYETISLEQLKSRYHVPGLLHKLFFGGELPKVGEFAVTLYPRVQIQLAKPDSSVLNIRLDNRGGGIGRVEVRVNGSELTGDARVGQDIKPSSAAANLPVEIPKERLRTGLNKVEVVAWNLEGDVRSRSQEMVLDLRDDGVIARSDRVYFPEPDKKPSEINFYAVVSGISDYAGSGLHLRYAAKDAEDMTKALSLAARKYFCSDEMANKKPCGRVHIRLLSTEQQAASQFAGLADVPDFKRLDPTKQNYRDVFAEVAGKAKAEDVMVVYLSGHGTAITSDQAVAESAFPDMYLYPTRDATTLDRTAMINQTEREATTVSSLELAKWVSDIKADKKVMIFDTCAAGAAQKDLVSQVRADDALQLRSIDRLRERTGLYILMGSAANAVSYEANEFRQGLLTYSLIEAMTTDKGLRDGRFLDVENWFEYSEDKVENLAKGIGGVQRPSFFKSNFAKTFDIGRIERDEQKLIPLAQRVPLILHPELREKDRFTDRERLTEKLETRLLEQSLVSNRGDLAPVNYINAANAANGLSPRGFYTVNGDQVTVEISLVRDEEEVARITVTGRKDEIIDKLLQEMIKAAQPKK